MPRLLRQFFGSRNCNGLVIQLVRLQPLHSSERHSHQCAREQQVPPQHLQISS